MMATRLSEMFGLTQPIVLAPMGGVAGGALAAAVSNAGGLGLVGGGYGDPDWLARELALVRQGTARAWGVGLITWSASEATVAQVLASAPAAVMLSFGDPRPFAGRIRKAGCRLICQVQDVHGALLAQEAGADLIVAQGTEAGGHGGAHSMAPLLLAVADRVAPIPVLAAGGIADGRGLAAALLLGAEGALLGTRFYAATEALGAASAKQRLVGASASDTVRTRVFDIVRGYAWPTLHTGRALRNAFLARWHGQEAALEAALVTERPAYQAASTAGDCDTAVVWAGEGVDLIRSVDDAGAIVARIGHDAEQQLRGGTHRVR